MPVYPRPWLTLERGEGSIVWDVEGREYVDLAGGIAVNVLGHAHPAVVEAVRDQVGRLAHVSNLYASEPAVRLAEQLLDLRRDQGHGGTVFLCNSGAEANEAALKLARRTGRPKVVACEGSFHGRTTGALALTGQAAKRVGFGELMGPVVHVPFGDVDALSLAVDDATAAVFVEPVLGEGGVVPAPPGYLAAVRHATADAGALMVVDEVQAGMGRTGAWFGHEWDGVAPDVITLAKGLGGGMPIGACLAFGPAAALLGEGTHGSTFGGNPVAAAAASAVINTISAEGLLATASAVGRAAIAALAAVDHPLVAGVRGRGLLIGIALTTPVASEVRDAAARAGYLVTTAGGGDVVRLAPALNVELEHLLAFADALAEILDDVVVA